MRLVSLPPNLQHQKQQGFSLLEALIASTIFAAVLLIASSAFKFFMSMGSRSINSEQVMQDTMNAIETRDSIKGLHHYYLRENAISQKDAKPFFWGSPDGFTGITLNAIDFGSQPTRISVTVQRDLNDITNLLYCEYNNKEEFPKNSIMAECTKPKVLIDNAKSIEIEYFGWVSLNALYDNTNTSVIGLSNQKVWAHEWDASKRGLLPQYISILISYDKIKVSYQPTQLWFHIADADPVQFSVNTVDNE